MTEVVLRRPVEVEAMERALEEALMLRGERDDLLWQRTVDWQRIQKHADDSRGGGSGEAASDDVIEDRIGDATAARYHDEVQALARRILADLQRWQKIASIVLPPQPRKLQGRDMLAAQVAAEGWCVSCWRDEQTLVPIPVKASGPQKGQPYYTDLCRFCGGWKGEHGQVPPIDILQRHHDGRRITRKAAPTGKGQVFAQGMRQGISGFRLQVPEQ